MPKFSYTAKNSEGKIVSDTIEAKSEQFLSALLKARGLAMISSKPVVQGVKKKFSFNFSFGGVPAVQKIFFLQNLQVMVRTGFSLGHALDTLALQTENKFFKKIIQEITREVESGTALSVAMGKYPKVFPELFVNMIAAGEVSGKLDEVLYRLTIQLKKEHQLISKVRGALTYPIIVVSAMIILGVVMMTVVIPKLLTVFTQTGGELPLPTRILIAVSNFLQNYIFFIIPALIFLVFIFRWAIKKPKTRQLWHKFLLWLPIFGPIMKKINLARFTRNLSSLLKTDIPIVQTFQIISRTIGNVIFKDSLEKTANSLKKGSSIASTLSGFNQLYPPIVTQMISVGEESGSLDSICEEIAKFYEEEVDQIMSNLTAILEPVLILILGAGVGGIVVAVILPIYSLSDQIS
ncbi:type II secretion system F family protein [Candidatus Parcubacteria bacterium]|nr:MAG: type II secretion system F family protein [Candidatus Parcubacteria bacterium]